MADTPEVLATESAQTHATVEHGGAVHAEPELLGQAPFQVVAWAMLLLILFMVWKKVPGTIARGLDARIAGIRSQLDEATRLRAEAEALRDEYAAKVAGAEKDAAAMLDHARHEADAIVAKAQNDTEAVIGRRERMAQDKIAAAERSAVEQLRADAARASAKAAAAIIAERNDAATDKPLVDRTIAGI